MEYNSAQVCHYHLSTRSNILYDIHLHTNRSHVSGNNLSITINSAFWNPNSLDRINQYVINRFQHLGGILSTMAILPNDRKVLMGRATVGDLYPTHIKVPKYDDARRIIDDIFAHQEISASERSDIENALRELEKSAQFANERTEKISVAQKELIQSIISPYIDDIKAELSDNQKIKVLLDITADLLSINFGHDPDKLKGFLPSMLSIESGDSLPPNYEIKNRKTDSFYDCLITVAKIYISMGSLEDAIAQLGEGLPSEALVQQIILELFDADSKTPFTIANESVLTLGSSDNLKNFMQLDCERSTPFPDPEIYRKLGKDLPIGAANRVHQVYSLLSTMVKSYNNEDWVRILTYVVDQTAGILRTSGAFIDINKDLVPLKIVKEELLVLSKEMEKIIDTALGILVNMPMYDVEIYMYNENTSIRKECKKVNEFALMMIYHAIVDMDEQNEILIHLAARFNTESPLHNFPKELIDTIITTMFQLKLKEAKGSLQGDCRFFRHSGKFYPKLL